MSGIVTAALQAISGLFQAINNVFGHKNTPEMKDRDKAKKEEEFKSELENAIKDKDIEKIRNTLG
jgi:hypothetical protein